MSSVQLDDLPVELFEKITEYLSLKECARLERVNSEWRNAMRKEWRRLKIVNFYHPFFSGMIDFLNNKNNDSACVDSGTVCLQELAVKIHSYVQEIDIPEDKPQNRQVAAFLKKLSELSTPKLRKLALNRANCQNFNESDEKVMTDIAQCIPFTLESLELAFWSEGKVFKYFCDGFSQRTFTQLKSLDIRYYGHSSFRIDALQTPNLKELKLELGQDEPVFDIDNIDQLTDLETLQLYYYNNTAAEGSFYKTLEAATSHDCKFLQTFKKLFLYGHHNDEQPLTRIGRFSALECLELPWMGRIDTAGQLRIVRSIGQGCAHLKSLYFHHRVSDEVLIEVADGFHNLCFLYICELSVEQIRSFVNRLSVDRCMKIQCGFGPTEAEVQASGILNSHPNIRYTKEYYDYEEL